MSLMCKLLGHKWNGCKCERCDEIRDEHHNWDLCYGKCFRCGATQPEQHEWNGCICSRCNEENHDWEKHRWKDGCKCERCGEIRDIDDFFVSQLIRLYTISIRGEGFLKGTYNAMSVRKIGEKLNTIGGFELMLYVHAQFSATYTILGAARNLEYLWDGIGNWQG